ncbi:hypothetical protein [Hymenobacter cellulosilyticus]|uniref:DUF2306 domain-containing protein n=1 Tax=Hymenobacter cellulosilyticus TaxID=2932248 RepID=A0A8T9Q405_9BACT|nr:hypothetical protein [Hymenobacter cellulosilyticus]UOQ70530.1 hypothetical protein MUN79_17610 [Hymenobacter cellulosilyticus]
MYSSWGAVHLAAAVAALLLGTGVLVLPKWGRLHQRLGYGYVGSLVVMLTTSFAIYRQFHGFGIFHVAALLSGVTLLAGMVPVWRKWPARGWLQLHYGFMYLSVLELYVALVAEVLVRRPGFTFWQVAGFSSAMVLLPGPCCFGGCAGSGKWRPRNRPNAEPALSTERRRPHKVRPSRGAFLA